MTRRWRCGCGRGRLDELVGQEHILGAGSALRTAIESGHPHSAILYGPPGAGKTTLARIAAAGADGAFEEESAVNAGKAEIRAVIERARERRAASGRPTILFLDEIHRFNKAQQDALLPAVEEGLLTLIGATTENPYFEVNSALLSRCAGLRAAARSTPSRSRTLLRRALADPERGARRPAAGRGRGAGDARRALAAATPGSRSRRSSGRSSAPAREAVDVAAVEDALQRKALDYDRQGDRHYDFISAWIKATRGSDVDASLYYLAVMLEGGEDPRFIARRMVILASEDIGNADPQALLVADAAARAVDRVGLPECALNLAQACVYLALAPKSNASDKGARRRPRGGPRERRPDPARPPARRPLPGRRGARPRRGLPLRARRARRRRRPAAAPARASRARRFYAPTDRGFEAELAGRLRAAQGPLREKLTPAQLLRFAPGFKGRLSKLEPGRADTPAGGLDWGPPAGLKRGVRGRLDDRAARAAVELRACRTL